jgi:hypothetical protein
MSAALFAIFALIPPPIPGLKGSEKQIGPTFTNEADALHALSLAKGPNGAKLEVRPLAVQSAEEKQAIATAKVIEKEAAKAVRSVKSSVEKDAMTIAKAILLTGKSVDDPMIAQLSPEIRDLVLAKIAELSLPGNRAKIARESAPKARFKPLSLSGLANAIGVEKLDDIERFPKRPDTWQELPQYYADLSKFLRALQSCKPWQGNDVGENALNRAVYRRACARIESEMVIVNHSIGDYDRKGMPDWPLNTAKDDTNSPEANAKAKAPAKPEKIALDIPAGMNVDAIEAARKGAEKRTKINSVIRGEIGPGFQPKPVVKSKDYSGGQLSWGMKCSNYVATFSKG